MLRKPVPAAPAAIPVMQRDDHTGLPVFEVSVLLQAVRPANSNSASNRRSFLRSESDSLRMSPLSSRSVRSQAYTLQGRFCLLASVVYPDEMLQAKGMAASWRTRSAARKNLSRQAFADCNKTDNRVLT